VLGCRAFLARADDEIREDWPDLDDDRNRLRQALALAPVDDALLQSLHNAAANVDYRPINEQGDRFRPMLAWLQDAEEAAHPMAQTPPAIPTPSIIRWDKPMPGQLDLF
jgi:hypothetical protein